MVEWKLNVSTICHGVLKIAPQAFVRGFFRSLLMYELNQTLRPSGGSDQPQLREAPQWPTVPRGPRSRGRLRSQDKGGGHRCADRPAPQGCVRYRRAAMSLQQTACKLGHPFLYIGAEVLIAWILFDRPA